MQRITLFACLHERVACSASGDDHDDHRRSDDHRRRTRAPTALSCEL